jgi:AAT family amino acid transporter/D-serine/D-alanine/glycine transporter
MRKLSTRHVRFIALGGTIGAGLFVGSGTGIAAAGPSLLIAYALCGVVVYLMLRALGELALADPARGSFSTYADRYLSETAGFITGWSYWAMWVLAGGAEITAVGLLVKLWLPWLPQWLPAAAALLIVVAINVRNVRLFGELEFWLALVKIFAIVAVIGLGLVILTFPSIVAVPGAGVANLWRHGGLLPRGVTGFVGVLPVALFAFGGVEVIGFTAVDTDERDRSVPRAIRGVIARILLFYIGSMAVIMSLTPWTAFSAGTSPFVETLRRTGVPYAADVVNLVVITAALSACNTGLYAIGRTLAALGEVGQAPAGFARVNATGVPTRAIGVSAAALAGVVFLNWLVPERVLGDIMSALALLLLWTWLSIMLAHAAFRRRSRAATERYAMPWYPWSSAIVMGALVAAGAMLAVVQTTRPAVLLGVAWFAVLAVAHRLAVVRRRAAGSEAA